MMKSAKKLCIVLPVSIVGSRLSHTATTTGNIAHKSVILPTDSERLVGTMNKDYNANLEQYLASMLKAKQMLSQRIITAEDYNRIDTIVAEKYGISSCSIYRGFDLIYTGLYGNMSHGKES